MAKYSAVKATVNAYIKQNGRKEITGKVLNAVLNATIDSLGKYFQFAGGALPTDDPGTPDQNVCYLAGEPGVYTNFGGITIENEEVALLFWDGEWTKQRILIGIREVNASVDNQVGTPSVDVSYSGGELVLTFHNLKGEQGETGDPAGFGTIGADINGGVGTPGVSVETSGDNTAKNLMFHFTNLKGETGVTSVVATIDDTSGTPSCQVSLVGQQLTLAFSGLKGLKGDTGVSADYPITIYNGLDSDATDQALAAAQGKVLDGKVSQLDQEVRDGVPRDLALNTDYTQVAGAIRVNGTIESGSYWHSSPIFLKKGEKFYYYPQYVPVNLSIALTNATGTTYTKVLGNGARPYEYTATEDYYISFNCVNASTSNIVRITGLSLTARVDNAEEAIGQNGIDISNIKLAVMPTTRALVKNTDYSEIIGNVNKYGLVESSSSYWHSSPIAVKRGDVVHLVTAYQGSGMAIGKTDENGGYYRPLVNHSSVKDYTVKIQFDGYIAIGYIARESPTTLTITRSNFTETLGDAENYSDSDFSLALTDQSNGMKNAILSRISADISAAEFEREQMLAEVSRMTDDDILVQGSCGYSEVGGVVTDGTITWKIYKGGILYISGYGKFYDFIKGTGAAMNIAGVNAQVSDLGEDFWYYGFVNQNVNGIVPPFSADKQKYETKEVMVYSNKRYVPFGETINPKNNKPYGYAAPWYIYRTDIDWTYQSKSTYNSNNPLGIKYNRICIEEDLTNGGITYIGNWTFYRATAKSLILPSMATKIGCWGIRYSPVMETVKMGDLVSEIEDHGCSRMLALRSLHLSNSLVSFGYAGMESNAVIDYVKLPETVTSIGTFFLNGAISLSFLELGSVSQIPRSCATNCPVISIKIPDNVTEILTESFYNNKMRVLTIPSGVTTIDADAFRNAYDLSVVILKSESISNGMTNKAEPMTEKLKMGAVFGYCDYILIPSENDVCPWFYRLFDMVKDDGEYMYFKRAFPKLS